MRDIKFRAWDKDDKKWVEQTGNPYVFPFEGIVALTCAGNGSGHISKEDYSKYYELSQYTGLKDKNNKEIYEGDILHYDNFRDWLISWHEAGFYLQNFFRGMGDTDYFILTHDLAITREIIGNIYENSELLKDEQ